MSNKTELAMTMIMNRPKLFALLSLSLFALGLLIDSPAGATETINRKREKAISGEVTGVSKTEVTIKVTAPKADTVKVAPNDIVSIIWTGEPPESNVARKDEEGGRYQKAIDGYLKSQQTAKSPSANFKNDLEFGIARATGKMALSDSSKVDEAIKKLEDFKSKQGDHYRYYDGVNLLGQLYVAKKDFAKAKAAFDTLGKAPWKDYQMAAKIALGRMALAENNLDEAVSQYDAVVSMQPEGPVEESQRQEAVLGKARVLIVQKKYDDALKLLDEVIDKAAIDDVKVNAEAFMRKGDCLREQGADDDALLAYLLVHVTFSSEKALHPEALYRLALLFEKKGDKARAEEAREILRSEYENSDWTKQLKAPAAAQ